MMLAWSRPTRNDHEDLGTLTESCSEEFWETEIVADQRAETDALVIEGDDVTASGDDFVFATEWADLAVGCLFGMARW